MHARRALPWLLALGLVIRVALCSVDGMSDVGTYRDWGTATNELGLADGFQGIYFPFQYQLFALIATLASSFGGGFVLWLKLVNLVLECAAMGVFFRLAASPTVRLEACLMYWLNPFFLALFSLGYCDSELGICILSFLVLFREDADDRRALLAGIPLGVAFLMKPQVMIVVMMMAFVGAFLLFRDRARLRPIVIAALPAALLFFAYSTWFAAHGKGALMLARTYLRTSAVMPSLTADMLNVWHPVATLLYPGKPVWGMRDDTVLAIGITFRKLALVSTLLLHVAYAGATVRRRPNGYALAPAITFATLVVPLVMSGAHENHLYLAMLSMVLLTVTGRLPHHGRALFWAFSVLATVNLVGHYGLGENALSNNAIIGALEAVWAHTGASVLAGALMVTTFLLAVASFFGDAAGERSLLSGRTSRSALLATSSVLLAVYTVIALDTVRLKAAPRLGAAPLREIRHESVLA